MSLTKEVVVTTNDRYHGSGRTYYETRLNWKGRLASLAGALALAGATIALFADDHIDFLGDRSKPKTNEELIKTAQSDYDSAFVALNPAQKFTTQYSGTTEVSVGYRTGGNGFLGTVDAPSTATIVFNNGCLDNTAYDIDGGEFSFSASGLFFSSAAKGDTPSAAAYAELNEANPDQVRVISGNTNSVNLTFNGVETSSSLEPADEQTQRILDTYGCKVGVQGIITP